MKNVTVANPSNAAVIPSSNEALKFVTGPLAVTNNEDTTLDFVTGPIVEPAQVTPEKRLEAYYQLLNDTFGINLKKEYDRIPKEKLGELWKNEATFVSDMMASNLTGIKPGMRLHRITASVPFCSENCFFAEKRGSLDNLPEDAVFIKEDWPSVFESYHQAENLLDMDFSAQWLKNTERGVIDTNKMTRLEYIRRIAKLYDGKRIKRGMYLGKIRKDLPMTERNMMFSYMRRGPYVHGLTLTKIYTHWMYYKSATKRKIDPKLFSSYSVYELDYLPKKHMRILRDGVYKTMEDIIYEDLNDGFHKEEMAKLENGWNSIPKSCCGFASKMDFFAWSILYGFAKEQELRFFGSKKEKWNARNCCWGYFEPVNNILAALDKRNMSQSELARLTGEWVTDVNRWCHDRINIPEHAKDSIAQVLGMSRKELGIG